MDIFKILEQEGYFREGEDNLIHAEKAFFAARVMNWIRNKIKTDPDFNLQGYLTMLIYYKTGMADLKFSDTEDTLLYKMKNPDQEVQEIVDVYKDDRESTGEHEEDYVSPPEGTDGNSDA